MENTSRIRSYDLFSCAARELCLGAGRIALKLSSRLSTGISNYIAKDLETEVNYRLGDRYYEATAALRDPAVTPSARTEWYAKPGSLEYRLDPARLKRATRVASRMSVRSKGLGSYLARTLHAFLSM